METITTNICKMEIECKKKESIIKAYEIYNDYNEIIYKGELKNGLPDGKGEQWDYFEGKRHEHLGTKFNIITRYFSGTFKNGKRNGIGSQYSENLCQLEFHGNWKNGKRDGYGVEYVPCKDSDNRVYGNVKVKYEGGWKNNKRHGPGALYSDPIITKTKNSVGCEIYTELPTKILYKGHWVDNEFLVL